MSPAPSILAAPATPAATPTPSTGTPGEGRGEGLLTSDFRLLTSRARGFTLLELVLVMILICTALAISAPDLRGFSAGARMKNAAQQILALTNFARTQAASNGRTYRLVIDAQSYSLTAEQDDGQFVPETTSLGQSVPLPDGVQIQLTRDDNQPLNYVEFHPDGRTDPARIRLSSDNSELFVLCPSPSERFHVASSAEAQR